MAIELSEGARASLDAICDTFVPGQDGLPSATDLHVPDVILDMMGGNPSAEARDGFAGLIEGWDPGFAAGSQEDRERVLLAWCDSEDVMQRAAFQALRKLTLVLYYALPWQGEGKNPVDAAIGYPGPHGILQDAPPKTIRPLEITGDTGARLRRGRRRLGSRRRRRRRGPGPGGPRRRRGRGGRLLQRGGLRRRGARRVRAALPRRRRHPDPRPEHRPARRLLPRRRHHRQLHLVLPAARPRSPGVEGALRPRRLGGQGLRRQPRRGLGPDPRQRREQPALAPRPALPGGPREARLGLAR